MNRAPMARKNPYQRSSALICGFLSSLFSILLT